MYDHSSLLIVGLLFLGLLIAIEIGFRLGNRIADAASDSARAQVNTIQASLLGVLALLLGFTFSLALQRYAARSAAVVTESNAIGTALLRAELLPEPYRDQARDALSDYLDLRIQAASISLDRVDERAELLDRTAAMQNRHMVSALESLRGMAARLRDERSPQSVYGERPIRLAARTIVQVGEHLDRNLRIRELIDPEI